MNNIFKYILSTLVLTSSLAVTANNTQPPTSKPMPSTAQSTSSKTPIVPVKEALEILCCSIANSHFLDAAIQKTKGCFTGAGTMWYNAIDLKNLAKTSATKDKVAWAVAAGIGLVAIQGVIDIYKTSTTNNNQGTVEWVLDYFSLTKPLRVLGTIASLAGITVGLSILSQYNAAVPIKA